MKNESSINAANKTQEEEKTTIRLPGDLFWRMRKEMARREIKFDAEVYRQAIELWLTGPSGESLSTNSVADNKSVMENTKVGAEIRAALAELQKVASHLSNIAVSVGAARGALDASTGIQNAGPDATGIPEIDRAQANIRAADDALRETDEYLQKHRRTGKRPPGRTGTK